MNIFLRSNHNKPMEFDCTIQYNHSGIMETLKGYTDISQELHDFRLYVVFSNEHILNVRKIPLDTIKNMIINYDRY